MTKWFCCQCGCFYNENLTRSLGQKAILKSCMSQNASFLNTWKCCLPGCCQHRRAHTQTRLITALISQTDSPDRQTISSHSPDEENLLIACSIFVKAANTVSKHPALLLTHTNIILHNSADPDPTVHILLLAKGSVHAITTNMNHP